MSGGDKAVDKNKAEKEIRRVWENGGKEVEF